MALIATSVEPSSSAVFLPRRSRFIVGVDLGQSVDPSAVCVLEHIRGVIDYNSEWERHTNIGLLKQKKASRYHVRHLARLPLGTSYPAVVAHVKELLARPPLSGDDEHVRPAELVVDESGVGKAVGDIFDAAGLRPTKITITGGLETTTAGERRWHVSKSSLISNLDAALHAGELQFAKALRESEAMKVELQNFNRSVSAAGRFSYAARVGQHDDLVLAVAIALWWAARPPPPPLTYGYYSSEGIVITSPVDDW